MGSDAFDASFDETIARLMQEEEDLRYAQSLNSSSSVSSPFVYTADPTRWDLDDDFVYEKASKRKNKAISQREKGCVQRAKAVIALQKLDPSSLLLEPVGKKGTSHITPAMMDQLEQKPICPFSSQQIKAIKSAVAPKPKPTPKPTPTPAEQTADKENVDQEDAAEKGSTQAPKPEPKVDPSRRARLLQKKRWISRSASVLRKSMAVKYYALLANNCKSQLIYMKSSRPVMKKKKAHRRRRVVNPQRSLDVFGASFLLTHLEELSKQVQGLTTIPVPSHLVTRFVAQMQRLGTRPTLSFHGTADCNFKSICQRGFLIAGHGGVRMVHGSAYGTGVYTGATASVSQSYGSCVFVCATLITPKTTLGPGMYVSFEESHVLPVFKISQM